ncbi:MAG: hypothetical protein HC822_09915 [Oscillochloris sp.]|nr:hypothetical protein [Oscillochloris sp.]
MSNQSPLRHDRLNLFALLVALIGGLSLFVLFRNHGFDDSYITFRYAANLAAGQGFVYNPGERILSTTAPLYALLLTPAALVGFDLPLVGNLLSYLGYAGGGLALFQLGRIWERPLAGTGAGLIYLCYPLWIGALGGETGLYQALVLWGFVAVAAHRPKTAAGLLAVATLVRADGALAGLCAGIFIVTTAWNLLPPGRRNLNSLLRHLPWDAAAVYLLIVIAWLIFAWSYFGSPFPITLDVKQRQSLIAASRPFLGGLIDYLGGVWSLPLYRPMFLLALAGLLATIRRPVWLLPIGWGMLYGVAYMLLDVPGYFWYYTAPLTALLIAAGVGLDAVFGFVARFTPRLAPVVAALLLAVILSGEAASLGYLYQRPDQRLEPYRAVGTWLAANTAHDESVGALEVGIIGYYSRRPMVDFAGLINPDISEHYSVAGGYRDSARYAITHYQPALVVVQEPELPLTAISAAPEQCREVFRHSGPGPTSRLIIYRCR